MATVRICEACEGRVSDQAESCPHCGHPFVRRGISFTTWMRLIFGTLMCLIGAVLIQSCVRALS
jgi:hypothetical protein